MSLRRVLAGVSVLVLLSLILIGIWYSRDNDRTASIAPPAAVSLPAGTSTEPQPEFSDADLQAGLAALCSNIVQTSPEAEPTQTYELKIEAVSDRLSASSSAEHLLAAALLQTDSAAQMELINRAVAESPADPLVLWSAVRICSDSPDSPVCPQQEWEQRLITVDGQNSESWARIASNRYASGDQNAALEAMRYASVAGESRTYWTETIELIERGLLTVGDFAFFERANYAIGIAATELPSYRGVTTMCREQSAESAEWADVCLRYGELLEKQGKTEISASIARSLQRLVLEAVGESESAAEVEARSRARSREFGNAAGRLNGPAGQLLFQSPAFFYAYLSAIRAEGETAAMQRITSDIERLIRQRPELACQ